ncbi:MAG: tryptophanase [Bacteroidales bacterium]|jgi:tryptophanase
MQLPFTEPYRIKMVEAIHPSTREQREKWIKDAHYNLFALNSEQVYIDLLTDSGTGAMSDKQWSAMMLGDESYAGSSSYFNLKNAIKDILGFDYFIPTHQGRAAENILFSTLVKENDLIPGNSHFDTTKGHIEFRKAFAVDCTIDEAFDTSNTHPFKGNVDLNKLEDVLKKKSDKQRIPFIVMTVTCNSSGGQPVSLKNLKEVKALATKYDVPVFYDSARFAENAYFIKMREEGQQDKSIREIVKEMYSYCDAMTMSSKKDAIVNIGGFVAMRDPDLFQKVSVFSILNEGYITYGGLAGRDLNAIAQGLYEGTEFEYLDSRIKQVGLLGKRLTDFGVPVQLPYGGHAIFVDASKILTQVPKEQFKAQTLGIELYIEAGVRAVEIGALLADRDPVTRENRYPELELLRLAIPRRTYTNDHLNYVAVAMANVFERRNSIKTGYAITYEAPVLRHFTIKLEKI